jgi:hypothetical protein
MAEQDKISASLVRVESQLLESPPEALVFGLGNVRFHFTSQLYPSGVISA